MSDVEVGPALADIRGEPEQAGDRIRKLIAGDARGTAVLSHAPGVRTPTLKALAQPLLNTNQKTFVRRIGIVKHSPNTPKVLVEPQILVCRVIRPQISRRSLG